VEIVRAMASIYEKNDVFGIGFADFFSLCMVVVVVGD